LTEKLLARLGVREPEGLVGLVHRGDWDRAALAALAALVVEAADAGDAVAGELLDVAARELAEAAGAVVRALGFDGTVPVALAGGLLVGSERYRQRVRAALAATAPGLRPGPVALVSEPAEGAVRLAREVLHSG
ncbi:MAG TPA: hypothetical protein VIL46_03450, partial [Gemmataceae bacterium]